MSKYDVVIIGAGPGGYVAAIRAGQLGLRTAIVEREAVGGICLNWGCIPSKSLLKNAEVLSLMRKADKFGITFDNLQYDLGHAMTRSRQVSDRLVKGVQFLLKKNKVDLTKGEGQIVSAGKVEVQPDGQQLEAKNIIIATGSRPRLLPGLEFDGDVIINSYDALKLTEVPSKLVVVGGGAIGVEFAYFYRTYGSEVTIIELLPHILPNEDEEISTILEKSLSEYGIEILTGCSVQEINKQNGKGTVQFSSPSGEKVIEGDKILIAIGVVGNSEGLGLEDLGIKPEKSFINVNEKMQTSVEGIYAIGDVTGPPLLAHVASAQGVHVVETIAGHETTDLIYEDMPRATYCHPQVASLGLTEAQAKERGFKVRTGKFPFQGNGKAIALDDFEGLVKFVVDEEFGELLGAHIIGPEASELLSEIGVAKQLEYSAADIASTVHAHPTLSEAIMEAALAAGEGAIHI
ncbi:dihydrolipoyl dehydrogenase [Candidatus Poribacteria bacterium]